MCRNIAKMHFHDAIKESILESEYWAAIVFSPKCPWTMNEIERCVKVHLAHSSPESDTEQIVAVSMQLSDPDMDFFKTDYGTVGIYTLCEYVAETLLE